MTGRAAGDTGAAPDPLRAEFERQKAEIRALPDLEEAFARATELVDQARDFPAEAGQLRTDVLEELRRTEHLTLQQLADRLGIALPTVQTILEREKRAARRRGETS